MYKREIKNFIKSIESENIEDLEILCSDIMNFIRKDDFLYEEYIKRVKQFDKIKKQNAFKEKLGIFCDFAQLLYEKSGSKYDLFYTDKREDLNYCDLIIWAENNTDKVYQSVTDWKIIKNGLFQYYYTLITYATETIFSNEKPSEYMSYMTSILALKDDMAKYLDFYFINKFENEYDWDNVCPELKTLLKVALRNVLRQIKELLKTKSTKLSKQESLNKNNRKRIKVDGFVDIKIFTNSTEFTLYFNNNPITFTKSEYKIIYTIIYGGLSDLESVSTKKTSTRTMISNINKKVKAEFSFKFIKHTPNQSYTINDLKYKINPNL